MIYFHRDEDLIILSFCAGRRALSSQSAILRSIVIYSDDYVVDVEVCEYDCCSTLRQLYSRGSGKESSHDVSRPSHSAVSWNWSLDEDRD